MEITLDEIITSAYQIDCNRYSNDSDHVFSSKHNRAIKRILNTYEKKKANLYNNYVQESNFRWNRKSFILILVAIFLAILAGCAVAAYYLGGFRAIPHTDNTELIPIQLDNCPNVIEELYSLSEVPEGFELFEADHSDYYNYNAYMNCETNEVITFSQWVKDAYVGHANTEHHEIEEIEINGKKGVVIDYSDENTVGCSIVWDNGDYILELLADLPKIELLNLANSTKY